MLYSGSIELLASIAIEQISATISSLRRSDNGASWMHDGKAVREITLPTINQIDQSPDGLIDDGSFSKGGDATVVYDEFGGLSFANESGSSLKGQFVGGSDSTSPGVAVIGTWEVGSGESAKLNGSFGAEHVGTNAATLPSSISEVNYGYPDSGISGDNDKLSIPIGGDSSHEYTLVGLASSTRSFTNPSRTATLRLRNTSLTRFGAWKLVTTSEGSSTTLSGSGIFSYSQLLSTNYDGDNANFRPIRGIAQYAGRTVAVDSDGDLYDGTYRLNVTWGTSSSSISAAVSGLSGFTLGGVAVTQIGFQDTITDTGTTFSSPTAATVQYATGSQGVALPSGSTRTHEGAFLGNGGPDGPYAVVGAWSLTTAGSSYWIKGSFGADLVRAP